MVVKKLTKLIRQNKNRFIWTYTIFINYIIYIFKLIKLFVLTKNNAQFTEMERAYLNKDVQIKYFIHNRVSVTKNCDLFKLNKILLKLVTIYLT